MQMLYLLVHLPPSWSACRRAEPLHTATHRPPIQAAALTSTTFQRCSRLTESCGSS